MRKKYVKALIGVVIIVAIAGIAATLFFVPNNKYKVAKQTLNKKDYTKAAKQFEALNGFLKSEDYLAEAYYNLGLKEMTGNNEDNALDYFKKSYNASKKSQHGVMAESFLDYYDGQKALEAKDYDKAMKLFKSSANVAADFNIINKASAGMAEIYYCLLYTSPSPRDRG